MHQQPARKNRSYRRHCSSRKRYLKTIYQNDSLILLADSLIEMGSYKQTIVRLQNKLKNS